MIGAWALRVKLATDTGSGRNESPIDARQVAYATQHDRDERFQPRHQSHCRVNARVPCPTLYSESVAEPELTEFACLTRV